MTILTQTKLDTLSDKMEDMNSSMESSSSGLIIDTDIPDMEHMKNMGLKDSDAQATIPDQDNHRSRDADGNDNGRPDERPKESINDDDSDDTETESDSDETTEESSDNDSESCMSETIKDRWKQLDQYSAPIRVDEAQIPSAAAYDPSGSLRPVLPLPVPLPQIPTPANPPEEPVLVTNPENSNKDNTSNEPPNTAECTDQSSNTGLDDILNQYHEPGANKHSVHYLNVDGTYAPRASSKPVVKVPCPECGKVYTNRISLRCHMKKHNPNEEKKYQCQECSYSSHYPKNLMKHVELNHVNSSTYRFRCDVCEKSFTTEALLIDHQNAHTSDNTYACHVCKKLFKTKLKLRYHIDVHNPEKPYVCDVPNCDRAFRTPKYLKNHMDEFHKFQPKLHQCPVASCAQVFQRKSHLKRHMVSHEGAKNYNCTWPGCARKFCSQETLNTHYFRHTGEKPFKCELCSFNCRQKSLLKHHQITHHSKEAPLTTNTTNSTTPRKIHLPSTDLRGTPRELSGDIYAFSSEMESSVVSAGGQHRNSCAGQSSSTRPDIQLDDEDLNIDPEIESCIDGIMHHIFEDPQDPSFAGQPGGSGSSHQLQLMANRIDSLVARVVARKKYNFFSTQRLTPEEEHCAEQSLLWIERVEKLQSRKRKTPMAHNDKPGLAHTSTGNNDPTSSSKVYMHNSPVKQFNPAYISDKPNAYMDASMRSDQHPSNYSDHYHSPQKRAALSYTSPAGMSSMAHGNTSMAHMYGNQQQTSEEAMSKSLDSPTSSRRSDCVPDDGMTLRLDNMDNESQSNGLPNLLSTVTPDIGKSNSSMSRIADTAANLVNSVESDLLDQVLEDLKTIDSRTGKTSSGHGPNSNMTDGGSSNTPHNTSNNSMTAINLSCNGPSASIPYEPPAFPPQDGLPSCLSSVNPTPSSHTHRQGLADGQQPKSLDSSLWSDSGYSSGHDTNKLAEAGRGLSGLLDPSKFANSAEYKSAAAAAALSGSLLDMYSPYYQSSGQRPPNVSSAYNMPNPYEAAATSYSRTAANGSFDLSQAYQRAACGGLGSAMGDHLRSLTALGSKYMDSGSYSGTSQLPGSSLSGLGSASSLTGIPSWHSANSTSRSPYTGLTDPSGQYSWPTGIPTPTSTPSGVPPPSDAHSANVDSDSSNVTGPSAADFSGYADYLSARAAAASSLNPFDPTNGNAVDAYRNALNDYRSSLAQNPTAADLYSQMAGYDKYSSFYSGREGLYAGGQRSALGLTSGNPFQTKPSTSSYSDRAQSYLQGTNPFYPQTNPQYYLAASRQFPATTPSFPDPYRSSMLHSMPGFSRYPF